MLQVLLPIFYTNISFEFMLFMSDNCDKARFISSTVVRRADKLPTTYELKITYLTPVPYYPVGITRQTVGRY